MGLNDTLTHGIPAGQALWFSQAQRLASGDWVRLMPGAHRALDERPQSYRPRAARHDPLRQAMRHPPQWAAVFTTTAWAPQQRLNPPLPHGLSSGTAAGARGVLWARRRRRGRTERTIGRRGGGGGAQ